MRDTDLEAMGLTRIEAPNYRDAMRQINERYGHDVAIVHTRTLRARGVLGLLGVTGVEVFVTSTQQYQAWRERGSRAPTVKPERALRPAAPVDGSTAEPGGSGGSDRLRGAPVTDGREVLRSLKELQDQIRSVLSESPRAWSSVEIPPHPVLREAQAVLREEGFSVEMQGTLLEALAHRNLPGTSRDPSEISVLAKIAVKELLRPKIPPCQPIALDPGPGVVPQRLVALVGPTGVGKTTTIAKLASSLHLKRQCKVGLITLDTYRIGAADQLGRYAAITGLQLVVVGAGDSAAAALQSLAGCQVVFVDTAGRSHRDAARLDELRGMLSHFGELETHLCISATASTSNQLEVIDGFRSVSYDRLVVTKIDEVSRGGGLFDLLQKARVPVSYVTCGQEVPDDIRAASEDGLLDLLVRG
ncbi:MAG: hypothetical protein AB7O52_05000 [Planctomycetota bacterium]